MIFCGVGQPEISKNTEESVGGFVDSIVSSPLHPLSHLFPPRDPVRFIAPVSVSISFKPGIKHTKISPCANVTMKSNLLVKLPIIAR